MWNKDSLIFIANQKIAKLKFVSEDKRTELAELAFDFYNSALTGCEQYKLRVNRVVYFPPKIFINFFENFKRMLIKLHKKQ